MTYGLIRPLLFPLDPERAHQWTLNLLRAAGNFRLTNYILRALFELNDPRLEVQAFGLAFKNPVGLAAGYDKNGMAVRGLAALGFGHIEVGTVTRTKQNGNARARLHRVPEARALINSMGFPNAGMDALRLPSTNTRIGINIGKSKDTPLEQAAQDYCELVRHVHARTDYIALNVSSPNTPGLRQLQARDRLEELFRAVTIERDRLTPRVPLLVKLAPDLTNAEIDDALTAVLHCGVDGIIATNTTVSRAGLPQYARTLKGGLSGAPLCVRSTEVIRYLSSQTQGKLPIIGVGGIMGTADALAKLRAGACLVQVYTGLVYNGPGLVRQINSDFLQMCTRAGVNSVAGLSARD